MKGETAFSPAYRMARLWPGAILALVLALSAGLILARLLMDPTAADLRAIAWCLFLSGSASLSAGWILLRGADQIAGLSIYGKAFLSAVAGSVVALLNIYVIAQLMFFSTAHDLRLLVATLGFSGVISVFFSLWVASTITGRMGAVASGIGALAAGTYSARVEVGGRDEVARLAIEVNELAARLQSAMAEREALARERQELTAAISHDLRTPLASVRAMVEALDDGVVTGADEVERYYGTMRRAIERLDTMINDLFELARLDAGALPLDRQPVSLHEIAAEVVDAMGAAARLQGINLQLSSAGVPVLLALDGARIERAIANLVRNALEHTPAGGTVSVRVADAPGAMLVEVQDTGAGIDAGDLARVWERFYRAERSRGPRTAGGSGLGLAIVRGIIEAHGGTATVQSQPGQGATFTLRLPVEISAT